MDDVTLEQLDEALTWSTSCGMKYWPWIDRLLDQRLAMAEQGP